ncbi:MAG: UDP-N-acetyl-D-mannosamine dehydrogenase [Bdellovibrionota bacterium]
MPESYQKVCVLGLGYIGLPTASLMATKGFEVLGVDVNPRIVDNLNQGKIIIQEPSLDVIVKSAVNSGRLKASSKPELADVFIIAVPTPCRENHKPDVSYVQAATESLAPYLRPGNLVILESTSPVGTTEDVAKWIKAKRPDLHIADRASTSKSEADTIFVAHCPERVLPGKILHELVHNDRIVGGIDPLSTEKAVAFYQKFVAGSIRAADCRTAELCKLVENVFRDVNIALANELSLICDKLDVDVFELIGLANHHPRVKILQPGPGVGGHCIAVDPWFVVDSVPEEARLIRTAREVNDSKPHFVIKKILEAASKHKSPTIACLGLSYKADVDDLRESPAIEIVEALARKKIGHLEIVEPHVDALPAPLAGMTDVTLSELKQAIGRSNVVVLLVDHQPFRNLDRKLLEGKTVIDVRGVWR